MTLMPAFDPYTAALAASQDNLAKAARNRPKEGDTKPAKGKKGGTLTFTKGRWRRENSSPAGASGNLQPKANQPAQQLNVISDDDAPAPKVKGKGGKSRKGKQWGADTSNLRPRPKSVVEGQMGTRTERAVRQAQSRPGDADAPDADPGTERMSLKELQEGLFKVFRVGSIKELENDKTWQLWTSGGNEINLRSNKDIRRAYRNWAGVPRDERNAQTSTTVNGIDFMKNFRPWHVFGLDPKTATTQDVRRASAKLMAKYHPDSPGGDRAAFEELKKMRDSLLNFPLTGDAKPSKQKATKTKGKKPKGETPSSGGLVPKGGGLSTVPKSKAEEGRGAVGGQESIDQKYASENPSDNDARTLGLPSRPQSAQELKTAYRQAAQSAHPDRGGSREQFEKVRGAYERLADQYFPELKKALFTLAGAAYAPEEHPTHGIVFRKVALA